MEYKKDFKKGTYTHTHIHIYLLVVLRVLPLTIHYCLKIVSQISHMLASVHTFEMYLTRTDGFEFFDICVRCVA